jgi:hypothetical protein
MADRVGQGFTAEVVISILLWRIGRLAGRNQTALPGMAQKRDKTAKGVQQQHRQPGPDLKKQTALT